MMNINKFQQNLLEWYKKEARDLPWRVDPSAYKVWISELMLQQTRVDAVIPYFIRFINNIPNVRALSEVDEERLLKLWQGLGYYNRAINLKKAAQMLVEKYDGQIPSDTGDLQSLPGIGAYTAGAIASIAFGKPVPAVDGNVLRVIARIIANKDNIDNPKTKKQIESIVKKLVPLEHPGDFNQAMMDLGAGICLPNGEPKCPECPVNEFCAAYHKGLTAAIPVKGIKKKRKIEKKTVLLISLNDKFALRKRDDRGLLANLWELPNFQGYLTAEQCEKELNDLGLTVQKITSLKPSKHIFTHLEWHMKGYYILAHGGQNCSDWIWVTREDISQRYSIPTAFKYFL